MVLKTISISVDIKQDVFYNCGGLIGLPYRGNVLLWNDEEAVYWYSDIPTVEIKYSTF